MITLLGSGGVVPGLLGRPICNIMPDIYYISKGNKGKNLSKAVPCNIRSIQRLIGPCDTKKGRHATMKAWLGGQRSKDQI